MTIIRMTQILKRFTLTEFSPIQFIGCCYSNNPHTKTYLAEGLLLLPIVYHYSTLSSSDLCFFFFPENPLGSQLIWTNLGTGCCDKGLLNFSSLWAGTKYPSSATLPQFQPPAILYFHHIIQLLPPHQRNNYYLKQVHCQNNLIEKIVSKQGSAIKFHQTAFLLYFIKTAGEVEWWLTKEKHINKG